MSEAPSMTSEHLLVEISIEQGGWTGEAALQSLSDKALKAALTISAEDLPEGAEVSVLFADDAMVQGLNGRYRNKDKPTNVLSFAANEGDGPITPLLGDIVLAFETVEREAIAQAKTFDNHLTHLLIHGFLHLLGYDHEEDGEAEIMEALEIRILAHLGIDNPYDGEGDARLNSAADV